MQHTINEYRRANGKPIIFIWDGLMSSFCKEHCWAMAREGYIYHAPDYYLNGWSEVVYECSYNGEDINGMARRIIFEHLNDSPGHRRILLESTEMAYAFVINNWKLYLTIRGK